MESHCVIKALTHSGFYFYSLEVVCFKTVICNKIYKNFLYKACADFIKSTIYNIK